MPARDAASPARLDPVREPFGGQFALDLRPAEPNLGHGGARQALGGACLGQAIHGSEQRAAVELDGIAELELATDLRIAHSEPVAEAAHGGLGLPRRRARSRPTGPEGAAGRAVLARAVR